MSRRPAWWSWLAALQGLLLAGLLAGVLASAPARAQPVELRDDRGATLRLAAPPQRIVSLLPSFTESLCALGACGRLVGVDRYSDWPASVRSLPQLGGLEDANIERTVALRPDVVVAARSARVTERLEALGMTVLVLDSDTHADVQRSLLLLARLLGTPERGVALWQQLQREIGEAAARVPPRYRGSAVYFEVESSPYAAGAASFIGQTLQQLGLGNIVPAALGPFPKLNPEFVVRAQPALVMAVQHELAGMAARPGWAGMAALRQGQVCGFERPRYEVLVRPGPRMGEAARLVVDCLVALPAGGGRP
ncbi:ABC transporter substrate-binding protein [Rubrivivax sp. RP6-9]|uniref:ABC transporter substrate-binding protein n=1 Tax=Rubrivivax sp. RP6-9 TaxID=3415750 RepID=UPI003CC5FE18